MSIPNKITAKNRSCIVVLIIRVESLDLIKNRGCGILKQHGSSLSKVLKETYLQYD